MVKKQVSCNDEFDPNSLSFEQALERIKQSVSSIKGKRNVTIREATGHILAEDVTSPLDVPPFINSAMDGYAINSADIPASGDVSLKVIGKSFAGRPFEGTLSPGEAVRIMTGAVVPEGADTVGQALEVIAVFTVCLAPASALLICGQFTVGHALPVREPTGIL